jgi:deazaflavin-dependent oxidoreductase (nitroreductase family)
MPIQGEYEPSPSPWVRDQVAAYEASGGQTGNVQQVTGLPVVIVSTRGQRTGKVRKFPLMRVEHGGQYALVASKGGTPENPQWYHNLVAHPTEVMIQDGAVPFDVTVRELSGDERAEWWGRAVEAFPPYAEYQPKTTRLIPIFLATRV